MNSTTWTGIFQLIMAGLSAFTQIWSTVHGAPLDVLHSTMTVGLAAGGANGVLSAPKSSAVSNPANPVSNQAAAQTEEK